MARDPFAARTCADCSLPVVGAHVCDRGSAGAMPTVERAREDVRLVFAERDQLLAERDALCKQLAEAVCEAGALNATRRERDEALEQARKQRDDLALALGVHGAAPYQALARVAHDVVADRDRLRAQLATISAAVLTLGNEAVIAADAERWWNRDSRVAVAIDLAIGLVPEEHARAVRLEKVK